jgi:hypothetical protein
MEPPAEQCYRREYHCPFTPADRIRRHQMMRHHLSGSYSQSHRGSITEKPEDEEVPQLAHLENALPSSGEFLWVTHPWDSKR